MNLEYRRPSDVYWGNDSSCYMVEHLNSLAVRDAFELEAWFSNFIESARSWYVNKANWHSGHRSSTLHRSWPHL